MSKGLDVIALALGKKYTDETVLGGGAIKGKNCTIKSIDDITGGHRINFEWTLDDGTVKADTLDVMDGVDGTNGTNGKDGKDGTNGVDGKDGIGIPNGGTTGQVLKKKSNTDYDTEWQDEEGGAVDSVNGKTGEVELNAEDVGAYSTSEVDTALASKADNNEIADIVNIYGAKNLIPYPYLNKSGTVFRGVTYTVNADGSITANGTATGGDSAFFILQRNVDNDFLSRIGQGSFILSGCPAGGSLQTYYLNFNYGDAQSSAGNLGQDTGNGKEITIDTDITQYNAQISILIREGVTVSNLTFYPMLRMASIKDDTFVLYAPTNAKLNEDKIKLNENKISYADNGVLGAKNLLPYPYYSTTKTQNGVTFTDNGDGTVTVDGTATDGVVFFCSIRGENGKCILPNGTYIVTGCPSGGAVSSYKIGASRITGGSGTTYGTDVGNGLTITLDGDDFGDDDVRLQIGIAVSEGTVCNNLVFKPMVRLASDSDNTYQPYAMTNKELTGELSKSLDKNKIQTFIYTYNSVTIPAGTVKGDITPTNSLPSGAIVLGIKTLYAGSNGYNTPFTYFNADNGKISLRNISNGDMTTTPTMYVTIYNPNA